MFGSAEAIPFHDFQTQPSTEPIAGQLVPERQQRPRMLEHEPKPPPEQLAPVWQLQLLKPQPGFGVLALVSATPQWRLVEPPEHSGLHDR